MVAGQHEPIGAKQRQPRSRLRGLARFVQHGQIEAALAEQLAIEPRERGADDLRVVEDAFDGERFELAGFTEKFAGLAAQRGLLASLGLVAGPLIRLAEECRGFARDLAGLPCVGVFLRENVDGTFAEFGHDPRRVPETHRFFTQPQQLFEKVIHGVIAGGTGEYLLPARDSLTNQFRHGRGLARARRPMNDRDILGCQGEVNGFVLGFVEMGERGA